MSRIAVRCFLSADTGYGLMNCAIIEGLQKAGIETAVVPTFLDENQAPIPSSVKRAIVDSHDLESEFLIHVPRYFHMKDKRTLRMTLTESTRIPPGQVSSINQEVALITCSEWGVSCLSACGIDIPLYKVPLFVDKSIYQIPSWVNKPENPFIFGCGGRVGAKNSVQRIRKDLDTIIRSFLKAFPYDQNVRLKVKITDKCYLEEHNDSRIIVDKTYLSSEQMNKWYSDLNLFVTASRGEGWGFMQLQALACAVPLLGVNYGGVSEFFCGFPVQHEHVKAAEGFYGTWAKINEQELVDKMLVLRHTPSAISFKANDAAAANHELTIENTMKRLLPILEKHNIIV